MKDAPVLHDAFYLVSTEDVKDLVLQVHFDWGDDVGVPIISDSVGECVMKFVDDLLYV